jgi:hypothetical protein
MARIKLVERSWSVSKLFLVRLVYGMCDSLAKSIILATANSLVPLAKTGRPRVSHELLLDQFIRVLRTRMLPILT